MANQGRLLIVDDEKVALKNLEHVMKKEGYEVVATQSGANALAYLEKQSFDVVLTDLRMEKVDGMQVLKKCRESCPDTEVILITGYASPGIGGGGHEARRFLLHRQALPAGRSAQSGGRGAGKNPPEAREPQFARTDRKLSRQGQDHHPGRRPC